MPVRSILIASLITTIAAAAAPIVAETPPDDAADRVAAVLDSLHEAAAAADGERYFDLFAPEAVFFGTDATERWSLEEFRGYAMKHFEAGQGWTYTVRNRNVEIAAGGDAAWFDEVLDNEKYGECRGTGVVVRLDGAWKIERYNLAIPIPNDLAAEVVRMIRERPSSPAAGPGADPAAEPDGHWMILARTKSGQFAVDPLSGRSRRLPGLDAGDVVSPDGRLVAYVKPRNRADARSTDLFVADLDTAGRKTNERWLTNGARKPRDPQWMPDSRHVVYTRGIGEHAQVYRLDTRSSPIRERRLSDGRAQCWSPKPARDGRTAYLRLHERQGKSQLVDLMLSTVSGRKTLVRREAITDFAWSPAGDRIAFSTVDALHVLRVDGGERQSIEYADLDERFFGHASWSLAWPPAGESIVARITFAGGRAAAAGQVFEPMFGDGEIFIVALDGSPLRWVTAPSDCVAVGIVEANPKR